MNKEKTVRNATVAVVQVVVSAITLFVLYRYLLEILGVESLGVWSVVLATTSLSNISQFGLSGSITKFVAKYLAKKEARKVEGVLKTAFVSIGGIFLFTLTLAYYPLAWVLSRVMPPDILVQAISLLPYALVSMWFSSLSGVVVSGLDGCQRADLRGALMIAGVILFTGGAVLLIPDYGLWGLAYAQIVQNIFVLMVGWLLVRKEITYLPLLPIGWDYKLFKEMIRYGFNFQIGTVAMMLFDPVTKMLMTKFGGLAMTGYFEMANRMILQFRAVIVAANQVLVPVIASLHETSPSKTRKIYIHSFNFLLILSPLIFGLVAVIIPYVSLIWIGNYNKIFILLSYSCAFGWFLNSLVGPAFIGNLGTGDLKWNVISSLVMGGVNLCLGSLLGYLFGGVGVLVGYIIALILGSLVLFISYNKAKNIFLSQVISKSSLVWVLLCVFGLIINIIFLNLASINYYNPIILMLASVFLYIVPLSLMVMKRFDDILIYKIKLLESR